MSTSIAPFRPARVLLSLVLGMVVLCALAVPAIATEAEGGAAPSEAEGGHVTIDDIGTNNEVSNQYKPEPAEAPPFMRFLSWPLAIVGFIVAMALLLRYLQWQPRFAEERRSKRRR